MALTRYDLSPPDYVHVPQAPRIERPEILRRGGDNEWQMWGVAGVTRDGERTGCPTTPGRTSMRRFTFWATGPTFERLDPRHYSGGRCRDRGSDKHRSRAARNRSRA